MPKIAAACLLVLVAELANGGERPEPLLPGESAPPWELQTPDGAEVAFPSDAHGRAAIIFFWATWCPFCKALMPYLAEIREDYAARGLQVYAIDIWDDDADPAAVLAERGFEFVLLLDGDAVAETYGVVGTPGLFVVDRDGRIVFNRYLVNLDDLPITEDTPRREKAALSAPRWAAALRESLEAIGW